MLKVNLEQAKRLSQFKIENEETLLKFLTTELSYLESYSGNFNPVQLSKVKRLRAIISTALEVNKLADELIIDSSMKQLTLNL